MGIEKRQTIYKQNYKETKKYIKLITMFYSLRTIIKILFIVSCVLKNMESKWDLYSVIVCFNC